MKDNYAIIMAGGIGSRFWPYSKAERPKQFLDILGVGRSLIQLTYDRLLKFCPANQILVITGERYFDLVQEHLPEMNPDQILTEPFRRNTAPCVAYGAFKIHAQNSNAKIIVAPSDHLIVKEQDFINTVQAGFKAAEEDVLITLGIQPTRPETGYGYIEATEEAHPEIEGMFKVAQFREKPDAEKAQEYMAAGNFHWNSGMFIWSSKSILASFEKYQRDIFDLFQEGMEKYNTPEERNFIQVQYEHCPDISVDYAILENAKNIYVLPCDIGWTDLGTWGSLHTKLEKDNHDNAIVGKVELFECEGTLVSNPTQQLVVAQGVENLIVVNTPDVLLLCKKDQEQKIKSIVKSLSEKEATKSFV
jgi:mannose-1-phosphate guanylyltransferase